MSTIQTPTTRQEACESMACILEGMAALAGSLSPDQYVSGGADLGIGSVGGHVRHAHDHVVAFEHGVGGRTIEYDARVRGTSVETDPAAAAAALRTTADRLRAIDAASLDNDTTLETALCAADGPMAFRSTLARELAFVLSHAIHHAAMIGAIARRMDVEIPEGFGVAPSTQQYRAGQSAEREASA